MAIMKFSCVLLVAVVVSGVSSAGDNTISTIHASFYQSLIVLRSLIENNELLDPSN